MSKSLDPSDQPICFHRIHSTVYNNIYICFQACSFSSLACFPSRLLSEPYPSRLALYLNLSVSAGPDLSFQTELKSLSFLLPGWTFSFSYTQGRSHSQPNKAHLAALSFQTCFFLLPPFRLAPYENLSYNRFLTM
jgi:hypothetical protein